MIGGTQHPFRHRDARWVAKLLGDRDAAFAHLERTGEIRDSRLKDVQRAQYPDFTMQVVESPGDLQSFVKGNECLVRISGKHQRNASRIPECELAARTGRR